MTDFDDFEAGYKGVQFGKPVSTDADHSLGDGFDDFSAEDFAPPVPEAPERNDDFPPPFDLSGLDLLTPPGFVGDVAAWIDSQCRFPRRRLAVASAITTVGNIGGLRHEDVRDGVTANMLAFCVAASATGKEAVMQATTDLHIAAGVHYALQGGIKSEQEIMRNLIEHQPAYYIIDEIGIFLVKVRNAQRRGGAAYLESVFGAIMSGYSKANSRLLLQGDTKRELRKLYGAIMARSEDEGRLEQAERAARMLKMVDEGLDRPFLSVVGFTTPGTFDQVMDGETATQGFVGRAIIVAETDNNPAERDGFVRRPLPEGMALRLRQIFAGGNFDTMVDGFRVEHVGERVPVLTDDEASDMLRTVSRWLHSYAEEMGEHTGEASVALIRRAYELVAKISFILAIPTGRRTVDHVRWSFAYVRAELDAKIKLVFANDNVRERPEEAMAARIVNYIDPDKGASTRVLCNRMKARQADIEPILAKLARLGMIVKGDGKRKRGGRPVEVWFLP